MANLRVLACLCLYGLAMGRSVEDMEMTELPDTDFAKNQTMAVFKLVADAIDDQLHDPKFQWVKAGVAFLVGFVMCFDGEFVFKYILILVAALFTYLLSMAVLTSSHPDFLHVLRIILSAEAAGLCALVAFVGYLGFRIVMGTALGGALAFYLHTVVHHKWPDVADHWAFVLFVGNICLLVGLYPFVDIGKGHRRIMAVLSSFIGALLLVSSCGFFAALVCQKCSKTVFGVPQSQDPLSWIDFFWAYCWSGTEMVGVFAKADWGINTFKLFGSVWGLDRILARFFWLVLFILGVIVQAKMEKIYDKRKKAKEEKLSNAKEAYKTEQKSKKGIAGLINKILKKNEELATNSKSIPLLA